MTKRQVATPWALQLKPKRHEPDREGAPRAALSQRHPHRVAVLVVAVDARPDPLVLD